MAGSDTGEPPDALFPRLSAPASRLSPAPSPGGPAFAAFAASGEPAASGTPAVPAASARPSRVRRLLVPLGVGVGYLALSVLMYRSAWADPAGRVYGPSDSILFAWYLGWIPHALGDGLDPFVTYHLNAPHGANILWSTPVPLLGLLAAPVTLLFGPVVTLTVLLTLAPALSAFALFCALRRWITAPPAAVAGLLYGFGPYIVGASYGHLHMTFVPFPPLLLILLDELVVRGRRPARTGALLGLAVAAQAMISEEVLATSALVAALGLVILALRHRDQVAARVLPTLRGLGVCAVVAGALLAWPLAVQFFGERRVHGAIQPHNIAVSDLLTFITPTPAQALAPDFALRHSLRFTGNAVEVTGYLGLPLVVLALACAVWLRRHPLVGLFGPLGVVVAVLSLGGRLHVDGRVTGIPLPWLLFERMPVISNALASRLALYLMMSAAIVLAVGLDRAWAPRRDGPEARPAETRPAGTRPAGLTRVRAAGAALACVAVLVPLVPKSLISTPVATPEFFTGDGVRLIPQDALTLVLPYPYPQLNDAMLWQAAADYRFALVGCYCTVPGPDGRATFHAPPDALTNALISVELGDFDAATALRDPAVRTAFENLAPAAVVLGPADNRAELSRLVTGLTGRSPRLVDGVELWLPESSPAARPG